MERQRSLGFSERRRKLVQQALQPDGVAVGPGPSLGQAFR